MKSKKILVVDFDTDSLNTLSEFLQEEGFQVFKAKDGKSGFEKFESERPDLIILEPMLPKLHGFDLCKNIAKDSGKETPIIFITEFYGEEQCIKEAHRPSSLTAFFRKPYKKEEILSSILDLLNDKKVKESQPSRFEQTEKQKRPVDELEKHLHEPELSSKTELSKEEKTSKLPDEISRMLQDTLYEFGLDIKKEKPVVHEKAIREDIEEERKAPEPEQVVLEPEKIEEEVAAEEGVMKEETIMHEEAAEAEEEEKPRSLESLLFEEFSEESKVFSLKPIFENVISRIKILKKVLVKTPAPRIVLPLALFALIAGGTTFYLFRPKKVDSLPKENASLTFRNPQQDSSRLQLAQLSPSITTKGEESQESSLTSTTQEKTQDEQVPEESSEVEQEPKSTTAPEEESSTPKDAAPVQNKAPAAPPPAEPMFSDSTPFLKIQENPEAFIETEDVQLEEQPPLASIEIPQQEKQEEIPVNLTDSSEKSIKAGDIVALNMVDEPPILIRRVQPRYPPVALIQGIEKQVLVNALISEKGEVIKTLIIRGEKESYGFNDASQEAVRQWRFKSATKNGVKVKVWKPILITFKKK